MNKHFAIALNHKLLEVFGRAAAILDNCAVEPDCHFAAEALWPKPPKALIDHSGSSSDDLVSRRSQDT